MTEYAEVLQIQNDRQETMYTYTYGIQRITNKKANDTTLYYQYDIKGSVIGQQNKNDSALHFKISYNDYGKPQRDLNNEYGYNAEAHDYNGTQYLRARYYNTDTGRFDKRDSYRGEQNNPISQHRYTYVWNSPNQYHDRSGNRPVLDSTGEDPALDYSAGKDIRCWNAYQSHELTYEEYLNCSAEAWEYYADNSSQANQSHTDYAAEQRYKAEVERQRQADDVASWEGMAGKAGQMAYAQGLAMGMTPEEAYYYALHVKKICEDLPDDAIEAVIADIIESHNGDFIGYFFNQVGVEAEWTGHDEMRGQTITIQTTELQKFLNNYFKNDVRWRDIEAVIRLIGELATIVVTAYMVFTFVSTIASFVKGAISFYQMMSMIDADGDGDVDILDDPDGDGVPGINPGLTDPDGDGIPGTTEILSPHDMKIRITHGKTMNNKEFNELIQEIKRNQAIEGTIKYVKYNGNYYIVDGHHRYKASLHAGLTGIPFEEVQLPYLGYETYDDLLYYGRW